MKCNQSRPGLELVSPCPFPKTITITPRAPPILWTLSMFYACEYLGFIFGRGYVTVIEFFEIFAGVMQGATICPISVHNPPRLLTSNTNRSNKKQLYTHKKVRNRHYPTETITDADYADYIVLTMRQVILNKSWKQHPMKQQLHGHLPLIFKTIQKWQARHSRHYWRSKDIYS